MKAPHLAGGMPAPTHHPAPETLAAFAAGTLRAGFDVVVAVHLRGCAQCRAEVARLEALGGELLSEFEPAALEEGALARTLDRLDEAAPASVPPPGKGRSLVDLLDTARRRWVAPGVWAAQVRTPKAAEDRVFMLRVAPGVATARHSHRGAEFTQIISGALEDEGIVYRAGDFVECNDDDTHQPRIVGDEPCVCLFATEGRLVPTDMIGRLAFAIANV